MILTYKSQLAKIGKIGYSNLKLYKGNMTDYDKILTTDVDLEPPIICIYGVGGIGKTSLAAAFPKPLFLQAEKGAGQLSGVGKLPRITSIQEYEDQLDWAITKVGKFQTLVIDSVDEIQNLKNKQICETEQVEDVLSLGYGRGTGPLRSYFNSFRERLSEAREAGYIVIVIAHSLVSTFKDPIGDDYNRYIMNLDEKISPKIKDWSDITLFINQKPVVKNTGEKSFGKEIKKVLSKDAPERIIYTEERPGFLAKNRYSLPPQMTLYEGNPKKTADEIMKGVSDYLTSKIKKKVAASSGV